MVQSILLLLQSATWFACMVLATSQTIVSQTVSYQKSIQPIFDKKCVACHACYESPCQVNLTSYEGLRRGAKSINIYGKRVKKISPLRLFVDEVSASDWHVNRGFWPVVVSKDREESILWQMLELKKEFVDAKPSQSTMEVLESKYACPSADQGMDVFRDHYRNGGSFDFTGLDLASPDKKSFGMPYGFPAVTDEEKSTIEKWIDSGALGLNAAEIIEETMPRSDATRKAIEKWEQFLNPPQDDLKARLLVRYLYEHWFMAHLYFGTGDGAFASGAEDEFYEIVRAKNRRGIPFGVSKSRHPYDPFGKPDEKFFYRLRKVRGTIAHKSHIPYELSDRRFARIKELFLDTSWKFQKKEFPAYGPSGSNPFTTFIDIPPESRYLFLLDDVDYFTRADIKGPVCSGQLAVNVIHDQGWKLFVDPRQDLSITLPQFFEYTSTKSKKTIAELLALPAASQVSTGNAFASVKAYLDLQTEYRYVKDSLYSKHLPSYGLSRVWTGNSNLRADKSAGGNYSHGHNQFDGAMLTVFRNFDNAVVIKGLMGEIPKTVELVDFPILERTYYNLVVGFDVFASTEDGVNTRSYKNSLRMESEFNFLQMFPSVWRQKIWDYWYDSNFGMIGDWVLRRKLESFNKLIPSPYDLKRDSADRFELAQKKANGASLSKQAIKHLRESLLHAGFGGVDRINDEFYQLGRSIDFDTQEIVRKFHLSAKTGLHPQFFPELSFLVVKTAEGDRIPFTLFVNRFRTNIDTLLLENATLVPANDTFVILEGYVGSYPNFIYQIEESRLDIFLSEAKQVRSESDWKRFNTLHGGLGRNDARFWDVAESIYRDSKESNPVDTGRYDFSRYSMYYN